MQILEQNEPSQAQGLLGIGLGRDETEQRPSLLGRTETETKHLVAPWDQAEPSYLTPETRPSRGSAQLARLVCRPDLLRQGGHSSVRNSTSAKQTDEIFRSRLVSSWSEICSQNSRPISSPRLTTDETNRFRVAEISVTGIATVMQ